MIYSATISTPASTLSSAEKLSRLYVAVGLVVKLELYFPPGSAGLMHVRIMDGGYQAFPATPGETFYGDNILLQYEELYDKSAAPFSFDILTYNEDDYYAHTLQCRMMIVSKDEYMMRYNPALQNEAMQKVFQSVTQAQAAVRSEALTQTVRRLTEIGK